MSCVREDGHVGHDSAPGAVCKARFCLSRDDERGKIRVVGGTLILSGFVGPRATPTPAWGEVGLVDDGSLGQRHIGSVETLLLIVRSSRGQRDRWEHE
jgi:hypothetical protein